MDYIIKTLSAEPIEGEVVTKTYDLNIVETATDTEDKEVQILKKVESISKENLEKKIAILKDRLATLEKALAEIEVIEPKLEEIIEGDIIK